jgi:predicted ester cyclase
VETYLHEVVAKGRLDLIETLAHPDMVDEANLAFGGPPGRDGLVAHVKGFLRNIGAPEIRIHRIVAGEGEVMAWWSFSGAHVGPWLGRPPTGERIDATVFSFFELEKGLVRRYRLWLHAEFDEAIVFDSSMPPPRPIGAPTAT